VSDCRRTHYTAPVSDSTDDAAPGEPVKLTKAPAAADGTALPAPPRTLLVSAAALVLSGVFAVIGALALLGAKPWIKDTFRKSDLKAKPVINPTPGKLADQTHTLIQGQIVSNIVLMLVLVLLAVNVRRGRHWSRWAVVAIFVLGTFTGTLAGLFSVLSMFNSDARGFHLGGGLAALSLIVAVIAVNLAPSTRYLALTKPVRPAGRPARPGLGGMFSPRRPAAPRPTSTRAPRPAASAGNPAAAKSKAKVRSDEAAVAKGAELARTRAKASKSRRTDV
jgi:heme/copper-type cytochrome/quinol oxidase subunit 4